MRHISLIRHGLTDWNVSGRFQGQTDLPLSEAGRAQAQALAQLVEKAEVDRVYASPLLRAEETARLAFPGRDVVLDPRLMELAFGVFEGATLEENRRHPAWAEWLADTYERASPGGESYRQLRERAVEWLDGLEPLPHIVAVTHSGTIQMLLSHILGVERPRWRKRIYLRHTSVSRILYREDEVVVERVNDTRHLPADGSDPFVD